MGKVRVGSQKAVDTLEAAARGSVDEFVRQRKWSKAARTQFRAAVSQATTQAFQLVHRNVTVNGHEWDYSLRDEDMEPKDREKQAKLKATQIAVFEAVERVADLRKTAPDQLSELVSAHTQAANAALEKFAAAAAAEKEEEPTSPGKSTRKTPAKSAGASAASNAELAQRLEKCVGQLSELTKTLPELLPRYERLLVVLNEEERLSRSKTEAIITQQTDPNGGAAAAASS